MTAEPDDQVVNNERPLTPGEREKTGATGFPIELSGQTWLIPDALTSRTLDEVRDRMFDQSARTGKIARSDVWIGAMVMLCHNYDLSMDEAGQLVQSAEVKELARIVWAGLIAPADNDRNRTYSEWIRASLAANGLSPLSIAPELVAGVLTTLVATGRAMPVEEYSSIARHAAAKAKILKQANW